MVSTTNPEPTWLGSGPISEARALALGRVRYRHTVQTTHPHLTVDPVEWFVQQALVEVRAAVKLLQDADAAMRTDRLEREEEDRRILAEEQKGEAARWRKAKHEYQQHTGAQRRRREKITPWDELDTTTKYRWFAYTDDKLPPTWEQLSFDERAHYSQLYRHQAFSPAQIHDSHRKTKIRRYARLRLNLTNPYRVLGPSERMKNVAEFAQTLSWAREEHAAGRMDDISLAVWEEHYARAVHAYTKPTEPYEVP